jgi:hypothetical protein
MSAYTKQHYIETVRIIRASGAKGRVLDTLMNEFAQLYSQDNPRFDHVRWSRAIREGMIRERPNAKERPL